MRVVLALMVLNTFAMLLVAIRQRTRQKGGKLDSWTMSYIRFINAYLPTGFKVWFAISSSVGTLFLLVLYLRQ
jgi:hypothetical protein